MCEICEYMLTSEHEPAALAYARKYPCPKCKIFAASGDPEGREGRKRPKPCYHCYVKKSLDEHCPLCEKPPN